jgi:hypothetical protein
MSPVRRARTPPGPLYRIARLPDPLAWPPREFVGGGRFDDPRREFRVLYAAAQRRGAFVETLAGFRLSLASLAQLARVGGDIELLQEASVPADWYQKRAVARLRLVPGQQWLDLREAETREALRRELVTALLELGLSDLDLSRVLSPHRELTQAIASWAFERSYAGIAYASRIDASYSLWAIFEGATFEAIGLPEPIVPDDADLLAVAELFRLVI